MQSRLDEARDLLEVERRKHPESPLPCMLLAKIANRERDWDRLMILADETLKRWQNAPIPNDPRVAYQLAVKLAFVPSGRGRARAIDLLTDVVRRMPRHAPARLLLGLMLEITRDPAARRSRCGIGVASAEPYGAMRWQFET